MNYLNALCVGLLFFPLTLGGQQPAPGARDFLVNTVGLTTDEMDTLTTGHPVVKIEDTGDRAEVLIFGGVFIDASPSEFVDLYRDLEKLEGNEGYLGLGRFSDPPALSDLADFTFVETDYADLRKCRQQNCNVQLGTAGIKQAQAIDWSSERAPAQADNPLRRGALDILQRYQQGGNDELGVYMNKKYPLEVDETFSVLVSRIRGLATEPPQLRHFLVDYPRAELPDHEDYFYWEKVAFGVKPTLRLNHVVVHEVDRAGGPGYVIVNKQLWASHYFQSAIDIWFAVED